jgi:predicted O-methyltransferase YrrM
LRCAPAAAVAQTLDRLHQAAKADWKFRLRGAPRFLLSRATGHDFMPKDPAALAQTYSSVTREEGRFLYLLACASKACRVVEFGSSFGISTLYLAAAARDRGGHVVSSEIAPHKVARTRESLRAAGVDDVVTVLEGDALQTLRGVEGPIDLLFLDGMKHLYLPVLDLLRDRLRAGAIVVGDNVNFPSARAYTERVRAPENGFTSSTLFGGRMEESCLVRANERA